MRKILCFSYIMLIIVTVVSCRKSTPVLRTNATIINTGSVAADGCGWLIKLSSNNIEYSPANLPASFQKDSLKVDISYTLLTTRFSCGMIANNGGLPMVELKSIQQRN